MNYTPSDSPVSTNGDCGGVGCWDTGVCQACPPPVPNPFAKDAGLVVREQHGMETRPRNQHGGKNGWRRPPGSRNKTRSGAQ